MVFYFFGLFFLVFLLSCDCRNYTPGIVDRALALEELPSSFFLVS